MSKKKVTIDPDTDVGTLTTANVIVQPGDDVDDLTVGESS